ncbi:PREDICTED: putative serine protease 47 [Galeopterus variegatus]|uniref:Serine protease 47 n=1 Tax=Galeopterus variegatus TaxID=482537 RepID=A0ABM0S953_GALVR|nr:PREDICTED: putative serine protease 47 [Galeopterus variegatus]
MADWLGGPDLRGRWEVLANKARRRRGPARPGALCWKSPEAVLSALPSQPGGSTDSISQGGWGGVSTVCGKPKAIGKIYGGQDAVAGQWPWQASLLYKGSHLCGAVLIDSRWLVSTSHCFLNKSQAPEDYQVLLGNTQLYQHTQHSQKMSVNRIISHPDFQKFYPFGSDIAMLQLHLPVNFTSYVVPACLPPPDMQLPSNASCWITGWGMLTEDMHLSPPFSLQEGKVGIIENTFCNMLYEQRTGKDKNYPVREEMLCAGDFSTGKSICRGDSGGPLICYLPDAWVLVGLASWGLDCRHPAYPSVFTRVTYFTDWINGIRRLTPVPDPESAPLDTRSPPLPPRAAASPGPGTTLVPPQTWLLPPLILKALQPALW